MPEPNLAAMADTLDASPDYRVLRRFQLPSAFAQAAAGARVRTAVSLDVETTGLDRGRDVIIQLSLVPFTYDADSGQIYTVGDTLNCLEDPGRPLPPEIVALTGITDHMVHGQRIDDDAVRAVVEPAALVIAHNAEFDRPFAESRLPVFRDKPWACSLKDVPWRARGCSSNALEFLVIKRCQRFFDAHRADQDSAAVVALLATPFEDGALPMTILLASARATRVRIWAENANIEKKDLLKGRGYQWNPGNNGRPKAWNCEVDASDKEAELAWLTENVYSGTLPKLRIDTLTARTRFSTRNDTGG